MKPDRKRIADARRGAEDSAHAAWREEQIALGLADIEAGRVVSDAELQRHFDRRFKQHAGHREKQAA